MSKILIVEDEQLTALMIQEVLTDSNYTTIGRVRSAGEAVSIATTTQPDLVLMNIDLEAGEDGITAGAEIYEQLDIPIIYLTASTEDSVLQRAIATEPFGYLIKPFDSTELKAAIQIALRCHQLKKRLQQTEFQQTESGFHQQTSSELRFSPSDIQQAQHYQQVQQLNIQLEKQVQEQTAQLQRAFSFEATLKRITDRVRDSLNEDYILQTAVEELALTLGVNICNVALHNLEQRTSTICYEYTTSLSVSQADPTPMSVFPPGYRQLLQGQHFQYCPLLPDAIRGRTAILSCPIWDDQGVLGDLWLIHDSDFIFSEPDIQLVQQVANQCAIALRQSRLCQSAQAQVTELERLNQLKDDFLSTVSHELRTPMANIKMAIQMLEITLFRDKLDGNTLLPNLPRYFEILRNESEREISLIDKLLNLSRLDTGTEPLVLSTIDLKIWVDYAIRPFIKQIHDQQQRLELDIPDQLPRLITDLSCLERILTELVSNACKYTPAGETITIFAKMITLPSKQKNTERLLLGVSNTGVEVDPKELAHIFDKFYRIPKHDPWKHGGMGLGLALAQRLVTQLGATIQVESFARQMTFTICFSEEAIASVANPS
jgi:signal transduction histidine kinase/DNA-binding response OmpR family regulator